TAKSHTRTSPTSPGGRRPSTRRTTGRSARRSRARGSRSVAFDAYRAQDQRPKALRRVVIGIAALLHGALIAAGVVYSYWHVDELTPPTLRVTFISAAPPPPPPPPPPAG